MSEIYWPRAPGDPSPGVDWIRPLSIKDERAYAEVHLDLAVFPAPQKEPELGDEYELRAVDENNHWHYFKMTVTQIVDWGPGLKCSIRLVAEGAVVHA